MGSETVCNCWLKALCLPTSLHYELQGRTSKGQRQRELSHDELDQASTDGAVAFRDVIAQFQTLDLAAEQSRNGNQLPDVLKDLEANQGTVLKADMSALAALFQHAAVVDLDPAEVEEMYDELITEDIGLEPVDIDMDNDDELSTAPPTLPPWVELQPTVQAFLSACAALEHRPGYDQAEAKRILSIAQEAASAVTLEAKKRLVNRSIKHFFKPVL